MVFVCVIMLGKETVVKGTKWEGKEMNRCRFMRSPKLNS